MEKTSNTIGEWIKNIRINKLNISAAKYSKIIGVDYQTIYNYESGKFNPSDKVLIGIARSIGIDITDDIELGVFMTFTRFMSIKTTLPVNMQDLAIRGLFGVSIGSRRLNEVDEVDIKKISDYMKASMQR